MSETLKSDKVFISYSWAMQGREDWVLELATRLTHDGVEVVLDKWDSVEGQNLNAFMQRCVNDPSIKRVLVICDEIYAKKADGFQGGVGTETVIISNEVYRDAEQTKFIPIVADRSPEGEAFIPTYIKGTKYIDMSSQQAYEDGYEKLIRNLYRKPEFVRPAKGQPPIHLLKDRSDSNLISDYALNRFRHLAEKRPNKIHIYTKDFQETFNKDYTSFAVEKPERSVLGEQIFSSYHEMLELKKIYVGFLEAYVREAEKVNAQYIIDFFESLYPIIETRKGVGSVFESQFDHMKLFVTELIINTVAILFKYDYFSVIKELIENRYFVTNPMGVDDEGAIGIFRFYPRMLEEIQPNNKGNKKISYSGHLIMERADDEVVSSSDIIQADFLLYLLSFAYGQFKNYDGWYPPTYPYFSNQTIQLMNQLKSKRYFEKFKSLLNVKEVTDAKELLVNLQLQMRSDFKPRFVFRFGINPEEIAMY